MVTPKQRVKYLFMDEDLDVTLTALWTERDTYPITNCTRVQITAATLFFVGTGARIAAVFPKGPDRGIKGLRYEVLLSMRRNCSSTDMITAQDIELTLHRNGNQRPHIVLTLSQRWFKKNRNPQTNA